MSSRKAAIAVLWNTSTVWVAACTTEIAAQTNSSKRHLFQLQSVLTRSGVSFFSQMQTRVAGPDRKLIASIAHMI